MNRKHMAGSRMFGLLFPIYCSHITSEETICRSLACALVQMITGQPPYGDLHYNTFIKRSSQALRRPIKAAAIKVIENSFDGSNTPLEYSGEVLLPSSSIELKRLLDSLFIIDSKLRPNAETVLAKAHNTIYKIMNNEILKSRFTRKQLK